MGLVPSRADGAPSAPPGLPHGHKAGLALPLSAHDEGLHGSGPQWAGDGQRGQAIIHAWTCTTSHQQCRYVSVAELCHLCLMFCPSILQPLRQVSHVEQQHVCGSWFVLLHTAPRMAVAVSPSLHGTSSHVWSLSSAGRERSGRWLSQL